jgi:hypothetical protein
MTKEEKENKENIKTESDEYRIYKIRESWLDLLIEETKINQSHFKGFFNLFMVMLIIYVFSLPVYNYINYGYLVKLRVIFRMVRDLSILWMVWPLFHFWSYTAYLLQLMILKGCPSYLCNIYKYITQYGILVFAGYITIANDMYISHVIFTSVQAIIHFFKMHSYTYINRDYRDDWLNKRYEKDYKPMSSYPNNINFSNFFYFLRAPTFVYQETYPRSGPFRLNYFILKFLKTLFCLILVYYVYTEHIETILPNILTTSVFEMVIKIYFPVSLMCCILFFLIFECVLPAYAELSNFGDRQFYDDWWNSKDLEEFNRKWNKIVYHFLYTHIYLECRKRYNFSRFSSQFVTFALSAVLHEFCLCLLIKMFRPYMTLLMFLQIPMILFAKRFCKNRELGNYFFWTGIVIGNPLIYILYNREYTIYHGTHY